MIDQILLGFVVGSGLPFKIPVAHTVFTGITQQGKSTAQEAAFSRLPESAEPWKILVFLTKRGERTFRNVQNYIKPFYRERYDWEYIRGLLAAAWHEPLKFETPWIIKMCRGPPHYPMPVQSLKEFHGRLKSAIADPKVRDFDKNIYITLNAYMDKVVPLIEEARYKFASSLELKPGLNVMDLTEWYTHPEMQMLIIRSCMEEILKALNYVIVGLPEAWKLLPQTRDTPVKLFFEYFVREGATNHNYLYVDTQDLGGMDKTALRQVSVWIMGRMQESNEVKRLLQQMLGVKIKPQEIQTLPLGHFLVASGDKVSKVYVWPNGIAEETAKKVAMGIIKPEAVREELDAMAGKSLAAPRAIEGGPIRPTCAENVVLDDLSKRVEALSRLIDNSNKKHDDEFEETKKRIDSLDIVLEKALPALQNVNWQNKGIEDTLTVVHLKKNVKIEPKVLEYKLTTENLAGKVMFLAQEKKLNAWRSAKEIATLMTDTHAWYVEKIPSLYPVLDELVSQGYLGTRDDPSHKTRQWKLADFVTFMENAI